MNCEWQNKMWSGRFGIEYTRRNMMSLAEMNIMYKQRFGVTRTELNGRFLHGIDKGCRILEVGCNIGNQMMCLKEMGYNDIYGIDIEDNALEIARGKNLNVIHASGFDIPFKDQYFDLVFTSGYLIHAVPERIFDAMAEIVRCSKSYIWGYEYYSPSYQAIEYRGKEGILWKADFAAIYQSNFPFLKLVKAEQLHYKDSENVDAMFLLSRALKEIA